MKLRIAITHLISWPLKRQALEVIKATGSYDHWVSANATLLGRCVYPCRKRDYFNAKATHQSVADNANP